MIYDVIFRNAMDHPLNTALKYQGQNISYGELGGYIENFAHKLNLDGFKPGDKLLIFLYNRPELIIAFFGANLAGGAVILADTKFNNELGLIIQENAVKWVVTDAAGKEKINKVIDQVIDQVKVENKSSTIPEVKFLTIEEETDCFFGTSPAGIKSKTECRDLDRVSMILYTSGSTGEPKGIINSHKTLEAALKNYTDTVSIAPEDRLIAVTPFFHSYAFGSCMLAGLSGGAMLILEESFYPRKILDRIEKEQATFFHGVPYMYSLISKQFNKKKHNINSLKYCISAGSRLSEPVSLEFFNHTGKIIHQEYGSTETGTIAINLNDDLAKNIKSVGQPLRNVQVRIGNDDGLNLIQVKSPGHSVGYVNQEPFGFDFHDTGDIGEIDADGYIYISGRKKRIINTAGLKVNPEEVEMQLLKHPEVLDVLVRGYHHDNSGELVEALVVRKSNNLSYEDLVRFCQNSLASFKVPKIIKWVESIPKSGTGKNLHA